MEIRASDEDRRRVVTALERHTGAGRLTLDEFAERVQVAAGARTLGELAAVMIDLPTDPASGLANGPAGGPASGTAGGLASGTTGGPASGTASGLANGTTGGRPDGLATGSAVDSGQRRELLWVFAVAMATLVLLGIALGFRA